MNEQPKITLDIVIPSFRVDTQVLESILQLETPSGLERKVIIILDDPTNPVSEKLRKWDEKPDILIIRNGENLGAGGSRNRGIEETNSDWVLFLDDDVRPKPNLLHVYAEAIRDRGDSVPGFVGVTRFPEPVNSFSRGVSASDILTFFDLAEHNDKMVWGPTSNLLVSRKAIDEHRFRPCFPKAGGGEDVDFSLEIVRTFGARFSTEPTAVVYHPWWNNAKRSYRRFFRWGSADCRLPNMHPQHRWRNFPNTVEMFAILLLVSIPIIAITDVPLAIFVLAASGLLGGDWMAEWIRLSTMKSIHNPRTAIESSAVRLSNDLGRFRTVLLSFKPWRIMERFDYGTTSSHGFYGGDSRWAFLRLVIQLSIISSIMIHYNLL